MSTDNNEIEKKIKSIFDKMIEAINATQLNYSTLVSDNHIYKKPTIKIFEALAMTLENQKNNLF